MGRAIRERFGKLPFTDLFEPAIRYATDGYMVSPTITRLWAKQAPELKDVPGFAEHFMPHGRAPGMGEKFVAPAHAKTLRRIANRSTGTTVASGLPLCSIMNWSLRSATRLRIAPSRWRI